MAYVSFANGHYDQLSSVPVEGGPAWTNSDHYQIEAKTESDQSQITMRGIMLQSLLEDRFKLKIHRETREVPIYALNVAKGGLRMQRFKEGTCTPIDLVQFLAQFSTPGFLADLPPDQKYCPNNSAPLHGPNIVWDAQAMSVEELCKFVLRYMDRPVVNETGLTGRFHMRLEYFPDEISSSTIRGGGSFDDGLSDIPPGPSIFTALQEQLGLTLERTKRASLFSGYRWMERGQLGRAAELHKQAVQRDLLLDVAAQEGGDFVHAFYGVDQPFAGDARGERGEVGPEVDVADCGVGFA